MRFGSNALCLLGAITAATLLVSCGGSGNESPAPLPEAPAPVPFGQIVVFGGTGSDTGNACDLDHRSCPPSPPYASGRYSNGPLWIETVAAHNGAVATPSRLGGFNYAFVGSTIGLIPGSKQMTPGPELRPTMVKQVDEFLNRVNFQVNPQDLIVLDASALASNIQQALITGFTSGPAAVIAQARADMNGMINLLHAAGARTIVVVNSMNVGLTPFVGSKGSAAATASATEMSTNFNNGIAQQITAIRAASPGLNLLLVDAFAVEASIMAAPAANGFTNVTAPCYVETPVRTACAAPDTYYYWALSEPTFAAGQRLAHETIRVLGR